MEQQIDGDTQPQDLTTVNVAMQRQQMIESEMMKKVQHLESLQEMEPKLEEMHPENVKFFIIIKYFFFYCFSLKTLKLIVLQLLSNYIALKHH